MRRPDAGWVAALLARYGLRAARWCVVASLDCTVLRVTPPRGADVSLRLYPASKQGLAPITTELAWLT